MIKKTPTEKKLLNPDFSHILNISESNLGQIENVGLNYGESLMPFIFFNYTRYYHKFFKYKDGT